ncbi:NUDIX domain-containing protein [Arthrobacter livingstonensis]|uniref:NUDIX domain-containing protein n=1 Tax=Arthrobacter livingstonensis TaxID=670078 RepID=UPI0034D34A5C
MAGTLLCAARREMQEETGLLPPAVSFRPCANWVTDPGRPKRFDTYFYLALSGVREEPRQQTTYRQNFWRSGYRRR